ncbi:MAG: mechanosensitive ion channel family protein [Thermoguttaceae bacterium]|nr:mechanosensitive ion channel family protein [Thermoguttaceae bacterium]
MTSVYFRHYLKIISAGILLLLFIRGIPAESPATVSENGQNAEGLLNDSVPGHSLPAPAGSAGVSESAGTADVRETAVRAEESLPEKTPLLSEPAENIAEGEADPENGTVPENEAELDPQLTALKELDDKTVLILSLDAGAVEKLKEKSGVSAETPNLDVLILPETEDESMTVEAIWLKVQALCGDSLKFFQTRWREMLYALCGFAVTWVGVRVLRFLTELCFASFVKRTKTLNDDFIFRAFLPPFLAFFWIIGVYFCLLPFLGEFHYSDRLILALIASDFTWLLYRLIGAADHIICLYFHGKKRIFNKLIFDAVRKTARIILVLAAICIIGQTILRLNVSALLAAAGIFGLAIAFAVKDTISNFLSSFMMLFDNSFQLGDRIRTGTIDGDVEAVDFRSTRIRALNGHLYSVPNAVLGTEIIENVSQRPGIRHDFELGLTYSTTPEQMERAVQIVRELISDPQKFIQSPTRSLVTFSGFGDWALTIKVTLWFNTQIFVESERWKHELNMAILRRFNEEGLAFAYPTHTVELSGMPQRRSLDGMPTEPDGNSLASENADIKRTH